MAPRKGMSRMAAALAAMGSMGYSKKLVRAKMDYLLRVYGGAEGYPFIEADAYKVLIEAILDDQDEAKKREEAKSAEGETSMQGDSSEGEGVGDDTAGPSAGNVESSISQPVDAHLQTDLAEGDGDRGNEPCSQDAEATEDAGEYPTGEGHLHEPCCQDADGSDDAGAYTAGEVHHQDSPALLSPASRASSPEPQGEVHHQDSPALLSPASRASSPEPQGEVHHQNSPALLSPALRASSPEPQGVPMRTRKPCYGWIDDDDDDDGELDGFVYLTPAFTGISLRAGQGSEPKRKSRWDVRPEDM